jgi:hypothetical protein
MAPMIRVARLFMNTPAQGALTPVYLASSLRGRGRHRPVLRQPQSQGLQQGLWQPSVGLANMTATAQCPDANIRHSRARPPLHGRGGRIEQLPGHEAGPAHAARQPPRSGELGLPRVTVIFTPSGGWNPPRHEVDWYPTASGGL